MPILNGQYVSLEEYSKTYRQQLLAKNEYTNNQPYDASHKNAKSDGDNKGKEVDGSQADILQRQALLAKNIWSKNSPYDGSRI